MNLILPIYSIFLLALLLIVYFSKKRIESDETKLFSILIFLSLFNITFNIIGIYLGYNNGDQNFLFILNHFDLPLYFWWASILFIYLLYVLIGKKHLSKYKKIKEFLIFVNVLLTCISFLLPFEIIITPSAGYAIGLCVNYVYVICGVYLFACLVTAILLIKNNEIKKTIPILSFVVLGIIAALIQKNIPSLIIVPSMIVFVELIMYFTIENPDVKMINKLEVAKGQLEIANQAKSDFISSMSHEIRTPLNIIMGSTQMLETEELSEDGKEALEDLNNSSKRLLDIVNGILSVSSIESGKVDIVESEYSIKEVCDEICNLLEPRIKEKPIVLNKNYFRSVPEVLIGDREKISQIVTNLMTNAIKYTKEGIVNLMISYTDNNLLISVKDTGIGIKKEMKEVLFDRFTRDEEVKDGTIEGTGLGLYITKQLVDLLGGKIEVFSTIDEGTNFRVTIPQKSNVIEYIEEEVIEVKEENEKPVIHQITDEEIAEFERLLKEKEERLNKEQDN